MVLVSVYLCASGFYLTGIICWLVCVHLPPSVSLTGTPRAGLDSFFFFSSHLSKNKDSKTLATQNFFYAYLQSQFFLSQTYSETWDCDWESQEEGRVPGGEGQKNRWGIKKVGERRANVKCGFLVNFLIEAHLNCQQASVLERLLNRGERNSQDGLDYAADFFPQVISGLKQQRWMLLILHAYIGLAGQYLLTYHSYTRTKANREATRTLPVTKAEGNGKCRKYALALHPST